MKIGYMVIEVLLICCMTLLECADDEKVTVKVAGLSLSASPSGSCYVPPSTPPIPTSMVSPYRDCESYVQGVAELLEKRYASEKKVVSKIELSAFPISFEKVPITNKKIINKAVEDTKEVPLSASVDSSGPETLFLMDDEE